MASVDGPKLISGNSNLKLAKSVARRMSLHRGMSVNLVDARVERFNDGEIFVEVYENVRDEDMFIIQSTSRPANDALMELLIIADALKRSSAAAKPAHRSLPSWWPTYLKRLVLNEYLPLIFMLPKFKVSSIFPSTTSMPHQYLLSTSNITSKTRWTT